MGKIRPSRKFEEVPDHEYKQVLSVMTATIVDGFPIPNHTGNVKVYREHKGMPPFHLDDVKIMETVRRFVMPVKELAIALIAIEGVVSVEVTDTSGYGFVIQK